MSANDFRLLDRLTIVAPLGIRFRDSVTGLTVDGGLTVSAYLPGNPSRRVEAIPNRTGVYVFHNLPGLWEIEYPETGEDPLDGDHSQKSLIVEVADYRRRFIPFMIHVKAPVKGLYKWDVGPASSPPFESSVVLYSAPTRPVWSPMAVVRAELWDPLFGRPASWAVVDVVIDGAVAGRGISDADGRLLVMFPYPEPKDAPASPALAGPLTLYDQTWPIRLRASYSPEAEVPEIPELDRVIEQNDATLWFALSPAVALDQQTLKYGSQLVAASESRSELLITATSLP